MKRELSPATPTTRFRAGSWIPAVASLVLVLGAVGLIRAFGNTPSAAPDPRVAQPGAVPGASSLRQGDSPSPDIAGQPSPIIPKVQRVGTIDEMAPVQSVSFPMGDLLSVSPDGRYALAWIQPKPVNQVELFAIPLTGGDPIRLGIAGYEPLGPGDAVFRLALPAWSADGTAVAFENGARGILTSLVGDVPITFAAKADAPITPLTGGGFIVQAPAGPAVVIGADVPVASLPPDLHGPIHFGDGRGLVGFTDTGEVVWTDGTARRTVVTALPDERTPSWSLLARTGSFLVLAVEGRSLGNGALVVGSDGTGTTVAFADACSNPDVSDDGRFVAYTVCDNTGTADSYIIRLVRLADGTSVDFGTAVGSPKFVPGTHRLAWLALSGNPPISPTYTVFVATNEVLP